MQNLGFSQLLRRKASRAIIGVIALAVLALSLSGCGAGKKESGRAAGEPQRNAVTYQGTGPIKVTVTTGMVADLVRAVGGKRLEVRQLLGSGVDPHLYKVSRDDVSQILKADLVVYSGLMLEGKMNDTFQKLAASQPVWAVTECLSEKELLQPDDSAGHPDPHVWMDVSLWIRCLEDFARRLGDFDPANRDLYLANASRYGEELRAVHEDGVNQIESIPAANRVLVTSHDAFGYFGRAYGIEVRGVQGISTESEAGLQQINQLVDLLVDRKLPAVFVESSVPRKSIEAVVAGAAARQQKVEVAGPLFADAMGEDGTPEGTYAGMMRHNFRLIAEALSGKSKSN
jgi:manganese/zinc/iron transport system substrate-binding protein